jgi:hypothetical protein
LRRTSDKMRGKKSSGRLERAINKVKAQSERAAAATKDEPPAASQQNRTQNEGDK